MTCRWQAHTTPGVLLLRPATARGQTGRLERTVRSFSTLAGVPSLLLLLSFMLLGGPLLVLFSGEDLYQSGWAVLVILSLGKLVAVWSGSCGAVLQFTGHQTSMLRVSLLTCLLFSVRGYLNTGDKAVAGALIFVAVVAIGIEGIVYFIGP